MELSYELHEAWNNALQFKTELNRNNVEAALHQWAIEIGAPSPEIHFITNIKELREVNKIVHTIRDNRLIVKQKNTFVETKTFETVTHTKFRNSKHHNDETKKFRDQRFERTSRLFNFEQQSKLPIKGWWQTPIIASFALISDENCWKTFFRLFTSGAYGFYAVENMAFIFASPIVHFDNQMNFHRDDGPAVQLIGMDWWFIGGVEVPRYVVEEPNKINIEKIEEEQNLEIRRVLINRYKLDHEPSGVAAYIKDSGAKIVDYDEEYGTLYIKKQPVISGQFTQDEDIAMLEVTNSSPELDGSYKKYFIRVPPNMVTAHQANAWTFDKTPENYHPIIET